MPKFTNVTLPKPLSLKTFHQKKNKVLIWNEKGGLGDVFMQRMLIEDFKKLMPEAEITFACLPEYFDAAQNHPFIDIVANANTVNPNDYLVYYNTCVTIADRYENITAPNCKENRADIWAEYCGLKLTNHEMHLNLDDEQKTIGKQKTDRFRKSGKPLVAFAPVSKMTVKTLLDWQIRVIVDELQDCVVIGLHNKEIPELVKLGIPGIYKSTVREWMGCIWASDCVVSVDTAAFHLAGGLKKPLTGIFTFADGDLYGKYYSYELIQLHKKNGNWDCGPCFKFGDCPKTKKQPKPCLTEITESMLREGVRKMMNSYYIKDRNGSKNNIS